MTIYCSNCGKQIPENAKFCPYCGEEVVLNRNNPDAIEITKEDLERQEAEKEVAQEVVDAPKGERYGEQAILVEQYEREIPVLREKRKTLLTAGIIVSAISFVAFIVILVLACVRGYQIGLEAGAEGTTDIYTIFENDKLISLYMLLSSLTSVILDVGILLIIFGAVVNTVKIKNRQRFIDQYKGK